VFCFIRLELWLSMAQAAAAAESGLVLFVKLLGERYLTYDTPNAFATSDQDLNAKTCY